VDEARRQIVDAIEPLQGRESVGLHAAAGRVLAEAVVSAINVPPFTNSAMDGFAVRSTDCASGTTLLKVIGQCLAGAPFGGTVSPGECVRIMTGAVVPAGADAVLMQEDAVYEKGYLSCSTPLKAGTNVRYAGEDTRRGATILQAGIRLGPAEIGLLASVGVARVAVYQSLRTAFFSTGDELTAIGTELAPGQIYDSNRYTLGTLLNQPGLIRHDLGVVPDKPEAVRDAFLRASECADLILTSGGVSVGDADYVTATLAELGEVKFWRMAMKPGKPLAFGRIGNAWFFGLPGNPVSVMATFYQFVLPAIRKLSGQLPREPLVLQVRAAEPFTKSPGRTEFQRGILQRDNDGQWVVSSTGRQGSHVMSSMTKANCFVILPADSQGTDAGELLAVQPFTDLVL
jgi:molybdopterin molybdotransferase